MKLSVISFTEKGMQLSRHLAESFLKANKTSEYEVKLWAKYKTFDTAESKMSCGEVSFRAGNSSEELCVNSVENTIYDWATSRSNEHSAMLFIGAMGIAIRAIAPIVKDKLEDAPVLVMDELGLHIIPVLSGHVGGANELALLIADCVGAEPVITTATDIEGAFSVDLFSKENNLAIMNREGIASVSAKALEGKPVRICVEDYPPVYESIDSSSEGLDVIVSSDINMLGKSKILLCPREYAVGIGCRRGTDADKLYDFLRDNLASLGIDEKQIGAIGSIDLKADENCLIELGKRLRVPFITFTPQILNQAVGDFEESDFVKEKTGVGNVCERAAIIMAGNKGEFVLRKTSKDGMTLAIVKS